MRGYKVSPCSFGAQTFHRTPTKPGTSRSQPLLLRRRLLLWTHRLPTRPRTKTSLSLLQPRQPATAGVAVLLEMHRQAVSWSMTTVRMLSLGLGKFGLLATNLVAQIILLVCSNRLIDIVLLSICSFHIVLLLIC